MGLKPKNDDDGAKINALFEKMTDRQIKLKGSMDERDSPDIKFEDIITNLVTKLNEYTKKITPNIFYKSFSKMVNK